MAHATGSIGSVHYATSIDAGGHLLVSDEPVAAGGANAGPAPYDLLLAGLCACTVITLRMYADRKQWPLQKLTVRLHYSRGADKSERIDRELEFEGDLTDEQRARMADIAERTPVTLTLKGGLQIVTTIGEMGTKKRN